MFHRTRRPPSAIAVGALALGGALSATAVAADQATTQQDLGDKLNALQAKIDELQAQQKAMQQQQQQQSHDATMHSVLSDADTRSNALDLTGISGGYSPEKGFLLRSDDGNFLLHPWFQLQVRNELNYRNSGKPSGADDTQNGFQIQEMKVGFDGNVFTPDLTYQIIWNFNHDTGNGFLTEAWAKYHFDNSPWAIKGGQFKNPLDHEQLISDKYQLAADRTYTEDILANSNGFVQGVSAIWDPGHEAPLRAEVAFTDGYASFNQSFQDFPTTNANYGLAGRVEYKLFGHWADYNKFTSLGNTDDLLVVGAGADLTGVGHRNQLLHVADVQWNRGPLGLYGAYMGRYTQHGAMGSSGDTYDPSVRLQASYLFTRKLEGFARYDYLHFDSKEFPAGTQINIHEFTVGANYYLYGQAAKFTVDVSFLPNGAPVGDFFSGVLVDNDHSEFMVRGQFQLLI